jgi:hypothetical protein
MIISHDDKLTSDNQPKNNNGISKNLLLQARDSEKILLILLHFQWIASKKFVIRLFGVFT